MEHQERLKTDQITVAEVLPDVVEAIRKMLKDKACSTNEKGVKLYLKVASDIFRREEALERMASDRMGRFLDHVDGRPGGGGAGGGTGDNHFTKALRADGHR